MITLSLGVSYVIWTGIGTTGRTIVGILFIGMIVVAVVGLKLSA